MFYKIRVFKNFSNFTRKHLRQNLFIIKLQVSILQLYWKKRLRCRCFLMNFARYITRLFYRIPPGDRFYSAEKYFITKIVKSPLEKERKLETTYKKTNDTRWKKTEALLTSGPHILLLFKNLFITLFCTFHDTLKAQVCKNNTIPLRVCLLKKIISDLC